jgi:small subunit ribosomal protein S10
MYKIYYNLKSFDVKHLTQTENYLFSVFSFFKLNLLNHQRKPKKSKKITVLRSPHIDKKSREQFQLISHKKTLIQTISNKNVLLLLFEILKDTKLLGVELEISIEFSTS